jgi:Zn-dependent protease
MWDHEGDLRHTIYLNAPNKRFGSEEARHILLSFLVLVLAFSIAFSGGVYGIISNFYLFLIFIPIVALAVGTGFMLHELSHKFTSQKYGCLAEYRAYPTGLMLALLTSLGGIVFAAPGAVYISGNVTREQNGKIGAAGPLSNVIVAAAFMPLIFVPFTTIYIEKSPLSIPFFVANINLWLAGFNMIPFPPLDGEKVLRWNVGIYVLILAVVVGSFVALSYIP